MRGLGDEHLGYAVESGSGRSRGPRTSSSDQNVHVLAEGECSGQRLGGGVGELGVGMLGEQQD